MKYRWALLIFIAAFFLQVCVTGGFAVFGASPNLILCASVITAFSYQDDTAGIVLGGLFALVYDFAFSQTAGVTALAVVLSVLLCIVIRNTFLNSESSLSAAIVSVVSVVFYYNIYWILLRISGVNTAYTAMLEKLPMYVILNFIVMFITYQIMISRVVKHKTDRYRRWAD